MNGQRTIRSLAGALLAAGVLSASLMASADVAPPENAGRGQGKAQEMKEKAQEKREERQEKREERREDRQEKREERQEDRQEKREERRDELKEEWKKKRDEWREKRKERRETRREELSKKWGDLTKEAPVRAELRIHAHRVAKLERIVFLAEANEKPELATKAKELLAKENDRHQKRMEALAKEKTQ